MKTKAIKEKAGRVFKKNFFGLSKGLAMGVLIFICALSAEALAKDEQIADPFEPAVAPIAGGVAAAANIDLSLEGIGIGPDKAYVILNGQVISEGEDRDGVKIVKVNKKDVDVIYNGSEIKLRLSASKDTRGS